MVKCAESQNLSILYEGDIKYFNPEEIKPHRATTVDASEIFSHKPQQWAYENEYRIVINGFKEDYSADILEKQEYGDGFLNVFGSIKAIILPSNQINQFGQDLETKLSTFCGNKIKVLGRRYDQYNHKYTID